MFCRYCGAEIPEIATFCSYCGAKQEITAESSSANTAQRSANKNNSANTAQSSANKNNSTNKAQNSTGTNYYSNNTTSYSTQQAAGQKRPVKPDDLQAFKKFITPYISRNIFIVLCIVTIAYLYVLPDFAIILICFTLPFGIAWTCGANRVSSLISSLHANGTYEQVLSEFIVSSSILGDRVRYSENYVFGKGTGRLFNYNEIEWVYRYQLNYFLFTIWSTAKLGDKKGKIVTLCRLKRGIRSGSEEITKLATVITKKNPNVLLGYGEAARNEYKRKTH
jgi:hypothetical protein